MFKNLGALSQDAGFNTLTSTPGDDTHSLLVASSSSGPRSSGPRSSGPHEMRSAMADGGRRD